MTWLKVKLVGQFKMTNLGQLGWYLGINFTFIEEWVFLSEKPYIENMLHMFGMVHYNSTKVPMAKGTRLIANMNEQKVDATTYRKMVGKLIYLVKTKPYFSFSMLVVSQFLAEPQQPHFNVVKQILG